MVDELELTEEEQKQLEEIQGADAEEIKPEEVVEPEESEVETEAETEVKPEPKTKDKTVPLAALHEARAEIKALRAQTEQVIPYIEQLKNEILAIKQRQEPKEKPISYDEDPFGYTQAKLKEYESKFSEIEQQNLQIKQRDEIVRAQQQVTAVVMNDEQTFVKDNPDYYDAVAFIRDKRKKELEMLGITDPNVINNDWSTNALQLSIVSLQNQKSPAQTAYEIAKSYGYQRKQQSDLLETVNKGQKVASRSISQGGATEVEPSLDALLNADGEEFDKLWKKTFSKFIR